MIGLYEFPHAPHDGRQQSGTRAGPRRPGKLVIRNLAPPGEKDRSCQVANPHAGPESLFGKRRGGMAGRHNGRALIKQVLHSAIKEVRVGKGGEARIPDQTVVVPMNRGSHASHPPCRSMAPAPPQMFAMALPAYVVSSRLTAPDSSSVPPRQSLRRTRFGTQTSQSRSAQNPSQNARTT